RGRMPGDPPGVFRGEAPAIRYSAEGERLNDVAIVPGPEWYYSEEYSTLSNRAFGRSGHLAVQDPVVYLGDAAEPRIRVFDRSGELVRTIPIGDPLPLTAELRAAWQQQRLQTAPDDDARARLE